MADDAEVLERPAETGVLSSVVTEFLQLLGAAAGQEAGEVSDAAAKGGAGAEAGETEVGQAGVGQAGVGQAESGEAGEPAFEEGDPDAAVSAFGAGMEKQGIALYREDAVPKALRDKLANDPAVMIGSGEWEAAKAGQIAAADKANIWIAKGSLQKRPKLQQDLEDADKALAPLLEIGTKLVKKEPVDLSAFGQDPGQAQAAFSAAFQQAHDRVKKVKASVETAASATLPVLDDPRNNPERDQITAALKKLEANQGKPGSGADRTKDQFKDLAEVKKVLFAWNDRRARENLPPAAEAVALGDLVQKMQQKVVKDLADSGADLPLPDGVDGNEAADTQKAWHDLVASTGPDWQSGAGSRINLRGPKAGDKVKNGKGLPTPAQVGASKAAAFPNELLTGFADLLQGKAGRSLVQQINAGDHEVTFGAGTEPCAVPTTLAISGNDPIKEKGKGGPTTVLLPAGGKDSDNMLATKDGNMLTAPQSIVLGHELIHALHSSKGTSKLKDTSFDQITDKEREKWKKGGLKDDADWTDDEEYKTIVKGKLSEQTLRAQAGLSAERYGHSSPKGGNMVQQAFADALKDHEELQNWGKGTVPKPGPEAADAELQQRGFNPAELTKKQKLEVLKADLKAPPMPGWPMAQLSAAQMKVIAERRLDYKDFAPLGWSLFDVEPDDLFRITISRAFSPRSPEGLEYRSLGGDGTFLALDEWSKTLGKPFPKPAGEEMIPPFAEVCTEGKLHTLRTIPGLLDSVLSKARPPEYDARKLALAQKPAKPSKRIDHAVTALKLGKAELLVSTDPAVLELDRPKKSEVDDAKLVDKMVDAMKIFGDKVRAAMSGGQENRFIDDALQTARVAIDRCRPGPSAKGDKANKRAELCQKFAKRLDLVAAWRDQACGEGHAEIVRVRRTAIYTLADKAALQAVLATPFISLEIYKMANGTLADVTRVVG